jgi:hypothetical protein
MFFLAGVFWNAPILRHGIAGIKVSRNHCSPRFYIDD